MLCINTVEYDTHKNIIIIGEILTALKHVLSALCCSLRVVPSSTLSSNRCLGIAFLSRADREIAVFRHVAPPSSAYQTPHRAPPHHGQVLSHHAAHMRAAPVPPPSQDEVQTLTSFQGPWRPTFRPPALFLDVLCELKTQAILKFCTFPLQYLKCPAPYFCLASRPRFRTEVHFLEPRRPS